MTRKLQGRIGQKGAELKVTMQALSEFGVCRDTLWPLRDALVDRDPTALAHQDAVNYKLISYEAVYNYDYKPYLNSGIPVVIGINTGRQFWKLKGPVSSHRYIPINEDFNRYSRGHAVVVVGYDDTFLDGSWIIANSSGHNWGDKGYAAIPYTCNVDIGESFAITNFAGNRFLENFKN